MGILDDLLSSDSDKLQDAHNDGQDSGAHHDVVTQVFERQATAVFNGIFSENGDALTDAFVAGQENGNANRPKD